MTSQLGAPHIYTSPRPFNVYTTVSNPIFSIPVGTTQQILPTPPTGFAWFCERANVFNLGAGAADLTIFDADGLIGQTQAMAAGGFGFCQFVSDKAVSMSVATDGPATCQVFAYLIPKPPIYVVVKPTNVFAAIPIVVPAGKAAVLCFNRFRDANMAQNAPSYVRGVNGDTGAALTTNWRVTRGALVLNQINSSNTKNNGTFNQNTASGAATGEILLTGDIFEIRLSAAPTIAGSYVYRLQYDLLDAI
jgi:hypothetical protein